MRSLAVARRAKDRWAVDDFCSTTSSRLRSIAGETSKIASGASVLPLALRVILASATKHNSSSGRKERIPMYNVIARWFKLGAVAVNTASNSCALVLLACIACLVLVPGAGAVTPAPDGGYSREQHG